MKNIFYISLIITILSFSCDKDKISDEQSKSFVKYYTHFPEFTASDVVATNDGYAILGTAMSENSGTQICLLLTDEFGNIIDSALYGRSLDDKACCLKSLSDGGFAILGSSKNPSNQIFDVYFVRTNSLGDPVWTRIIQESGNVFAKNFEVDANGSFFMTGYFESDIKAKEIWWFGIASDGNDLWPGPNKFGYNWNDEGSYIVILPDGDLMITGYTSNGSVNNAYLLRTDHDGSIDAFFPLVTTDQEEGNSIVNIDDNNLLLLSTIKNTGMSDISLKLIDFSSLSITWNRIYDSPEIDVSKGILRNAGNNYILSTKSFTGSNTVISVTTTDSQGNPLKNAEFGMGTGLSASSFKLTDDGGLIIAGTNDNPENNNTSIALIKLTNKGSLY